MNWLLPTVQTTLARYDFFLRAVRSSCTPSRLMPTEWPHVALPNLYVAARTPLPVCGDARGDDRRRSWSLCSLVRAEQVDRAAASRSC